MDEEDPLLQPRPRQQDGWGFVLAGQLVALFVGTLLNLVDAITYGRIWFPQELVDPAVGYTLFIMATSSSQLLYALCTSFRIPVVTLGLVECIPFVHFMSAHSIDVAASKRFPTIMIACGLSAALTSVLFGAMALSKRAERFLYCFPQTVLMGILAGISVFLLQTGYNLASGSALFLVTLPIAMMTVYAAKNRHSPSVVPGTAFALILAFWTSKLLLGFDATPWLIPVNGSKTPLEVYRLLELPDWRALLGLVPTIVGMACFSTLNFTINVPSLSQSVSSDSEANAYLPRQELMAHSLANLVSAVCGCMPTYLEFCNSIFFERSGAMHLPAGSKSVSISNLAISVTTMTALWYGKWLLMMMPIPVLVFMTVYLALDIASIVVRSISIARSTEIVIILTMAAAMPFIGFAYCILCGLALLALLVHRDKRTAQRHTEHAPYVVEQSPVIEDNHSVLRWDPWSVRYFANSRATLEQLRKSLFQEHADAGTLSNEVLIEWHLNDAICDLNIVAGLVKMLEQHHIRQCASPSHASRLLSVDGVNDEVKQILQAARRRLHSTDDDGSCFLVE